MAKQTLYDILGVPPDAMPIDVALAYDKRLQELRAAPVQDTGALTLLRQAHEVLGDPKRRAAYDASLVSASEKAAAKEQAAAPDLVLEPDEDEAPRRRIPPVGIAVGIVALLVIVFFAFRTSEPRAPAPVAEAPVEAPKPPPPPPPQRKSAKDVLALAQASVGRLESFEMSGRAVQLGLAVAIEPAAMVATCHGIPGGAQLAVVNGADNRSATLAVVDETLDLCRLSVAAPPLVALALADHDPKAGDAIYVLGANAAGELAVTEGQVTRLIPDARGPMPELSMPVAPNGSGGPVFDAYGKVIGIATTAQGHGTSVSLAIPVSWIARMRSRELAS
ncbi:MAG TPA: trypsin-like peptidase domain-containing protein [Usitatibacter sp.]|nr:trypsin-like peptidase domain-containing protein [Usitatibacter sp.]